MLTWSSLSEQEKKKILERSERDIAEVMPAVAQIIEKVRAEGDAALVSYTRQFNGADISRHAPRGQRTRVR